MRIALRIFVFYIVISSTISSLTYFSFTNLPRAAGLWQSKSMDWFLYDRNLRPEKVNPVFLKSFNYFMNEVPVI